MIKPSLKALRCAIYTRVSTEHGLEQDFNSLDAQREAGRAYVKSQTHEGWRLVKESFDDGGFSGGSLERPALQRLLTGIRSKQIDVVVVYKVDRLTRSLADFAKLVEIFDAHGVSFVSVTQSFNTTTSMGRLTLNMLLSFAQFEREVTGERIRDKVAASKRKGIWVGGIVPLGYEVRERKLLIREDEAQTIRLIFERYLALGSLPAGSPNRADSLDCARAPMAGRGSRRSDKGGTMTPTTAAPGTRAVATASAGRGRQPTCLRDSSAGTDLEGASMLMRSPTRWASRSSSGRPASSSAAGPSSPPRCRPGTDGSTNSSTTASASP